MFIVKEGTIDVFDGEKKVKSIEKGDSFGEKALFSVNVV